MLEALSDTVKGYLVPGSMPFFYLGVGVGVLLLYARPASAWGRRWLVALLLLYAALATPVVSDALQGPRAPTYAGVRGAADAQGATTVVVLGNGALTYTDGASELPALTRRTAFNVMEGVRLYRLLGQPRLVLSGGIVNPEIQKQSEAELMAEAMERLGIPRERMQLESTSRNTFEQSQRVAALLPAQAPVVLVTTPIHMPRAVELFNARGVRVIPSPCRIDYAPRDPSPVARFVPNGATLRASELSLYEYLAMLNGWTRGWLTREDTLQ